MINTDGLDHEFNDQFKNLHLNNKLNSEDTSLPANNILNYSLKHNKTKGIKFLPAHLRPQIQGFSPSREFKKSN